MTNEEEFRQRSCEGKHVYENEREARASAGAMMKRVGGKFDSYKCHFCSGWHITSKPTRGATRQKFRSWARGGR